MSDEDESAPAQQHESESDHTAPIQKDGGLKMEEMITAQGIPVASPSITVSLLVFWVLPVLFLAIASHYAMDTKTPPKPVFPPNRQVSVPLRKQVTPSSNNKLKGRTTDTDTDTDNDAPKKKRMMMQKSSHAPSPLPTAHPNWPTSYQETVETIQRRHRKLPRMATTSRTKDRTEPPAPPPSAAGRDPLRKQYEDRIDSYRRDYEVRASFGA
jgi:hypothetical protein